MDKNLQICHKDTCINTTGDLAVVLTGAAAFLAACYGISLLVKAIR